MRKVTTKMIDLRNAAFVALMILLIAGCGGTEARNGVSGTVTLDGSPLVKGDILFRPAPGAGSDLASGSAEIIDGKYKLPEKPGLTPGDYIVRIMAEEVVPGKTVKVPSGMVEGQFDEVPVKENVIPDDFGEKSTQKVSVQNGENVFDFNVPKRK